MNDHCALVVGIGRYSEYTMLNSPAEDASKFCQWLLSKGQLDPANIELVDTPEDGRPGNDDIVDALSRLGARMGQRRASRLYFYYAGHGLGPSFNDVAIVPANAGIDMIEYRCLGMNQCLEFFLGTGLFDELVVFMDCCRDKQCIKTIGLPFPIKKVEGAKDEGVNYFTMMGSNHGGKSFEVRSVQIDDRKYRGLMTAALLEGLNGAPGAIDASNQVTAASLAHFVAKRVEALANDEKLPQAVDKPKPPEREIVFLTLKPDEIPTITMRLRVGAETANVTIMVQNLLTMDTRFIPLAAAGSELDVELAGNTRHQLIVPNKQPVVLDPAQMTDPQDVQLP